MLDPGSASPEAWQRGWLTATLSVLGVVLAALGTFVLYVFGAAQTVYRVDGGQLSGWLAVGGGLAIGICAWRQRAAAVAIALAVLVAFNWILATWALPSFEQYKPVVPLSRIIEREAAPDAAIVHFDVALPSMVYYLKRHIDIGFDRDWFIDQMRASRTVFAVLPANRYEELEDAFGIPTCVVARHATSDVKLRAILEREPPPQVLLITNRCRGA